MRNVLAWMGVGVFAAACGSTPAKSVAESTLSGKAELASYPSALRTVTATDDTGRVVSAPVGADGTFSMRLKAGHVYRIATLTDDGPLPLVYPRVSGKVTATFSLRSDGVKLDLGRVRHRGSVVAVAPPLTRLGAVRVASETASADNGGDCVDCTNDDGNDVTCEDGSKGAGGVSSEMEQGANEVPDGAEASVAEHNVPETVGGCGAADGESADEADGDNVQQEGDNAD